MSFKSIMQRANSLLAKAFNQNQPRDQKGRWSSDGASTATMPAWLARLSPESQKSYMDKRKQTIARWEAHPSKPDANTKYHLGVWEEGGGGGSYFAGYNSNSKYGLFDEGGEEKDWDLLTPAQAIKVIQEDAKTNDSPDWKWLLETDNGGFTLFRETPTGKENFVWDHKTKRWSKGKRPTLF